MFLNIKSVCIVVCVSEGLIKSYAYAGAGIVTITPFIDNDMIYIFSEMRVVRAVI